MSDHAHDPYRVNSITPLPDTDPVRGVVRWDPVRSVWNGFMMVLGVGLAPFTASWSAAAVFLVLTAVTLCAGHSVGYHRRLVHRSFKCSKPVEHVLVWMGAMVGMGGPLWTIRTHDMRDWAQRQPACHDFLAHRAGFWRDGWWNLHCRLVLAHPPAWDPGAFGRDPFHRFLERTWMWHQLPLALGLFALGGLSWVVWGVCLRVTVCTTMHWYVSRTVHTRGPMSWEVVGASVQARDSAFWAIPTLGESWHNNHHAFPGSARHGLYPGQIDLGFLFLRGLERLGLVWDVQTPDRLPPRRGVAPTYEAALAIAAPGQAEVSAAARAQRSL